MKITYIKYILIFIFIINNSFANDRSELLQLNTGDNYLGNKDAKIIMIEYSSLSCTGCSIFHEELFPKIKKDYIDKGLLLYILRDYPTNDPALYGSIFANCFKPNYFNIITLLLKNQKNWAFRKDYKTSLKNIAKLSLYDTKTLTNCFENKVLSDDIVKKSFESMTALDIKYTPTFFINGKQIIDTSELIKILDIYIK
ncbi:MAG: protein-disulfide isomerase [Candidatus Midichloriaceae bacterium]|jgi:protein-disulfide isomerase